MVLAPGTRIGPHEIVAPLGAGGMGEVYRAHDGRRGRDVAVKVLPPAFAADPDRLQRFEHEARAAGALSHPNLLTVFDIGVHEGGPYIVFELLHGATLRQLLDKGPPPLRKAIDYAVQIAQGLAAAHQRASSTGPRRPGYRLGLLSRPARALVSRSELSPAYLPTEPHSQGALRSGGQRVLHRILG